MKNDTYEIWGKYKKIVGWNLIVETENKDEATDRLKELLGVNLISIYPKASYKICKKGDYWFKNY